MVWLGPLVGLDSQRLLHMAAEACCGLLCACSYAAAGLHTCNTDMCVVLLYTLPGVSRVSRRAAAGCATTGAGQRCTRPASGATMMWQWSSSRCVSRYMYVKLMALLMTPAPAKLGLWWRVVQAACMVMNGCAHTNQRWRYMGCVRSTWLQQASLCAVSLLLPYVCCKVVVVAVVGASQSSCCCCIKLTGWAYTMALVCRVW